MAEKNNIGTIGWIDLTVPDATEMRDFYTKVVGWKHSSVSMGAYDDFCMIPHSSESPVSGICYARGANKNLPPQWIIYIVVENLESALADVKSLGGELLTEVKTIPGQGSYCVIKDPAGAVSALYQEEKKTA